MPPQHLETALERSLLAICDRPALCTQTNTTDSMEFPHGHGYRHSMPAPSFPCPCCGHLMFIELPGSSDICAVCDWEDDRVQLRWPDWSGGANKPCLIEAQRNYVEIGAKESRFLRRVRPPAPDEPLDDGWRPIDLSIDSFEPLGMHEAPWPDDTTVLYWWRPTFWRR